MNDRLKINYKTEMIIFLWASFESRFEQTVKKDNYIHICAEFLMILKLL